MDEEMVERVRAGVGGSFKFYDVTYSVKSCGAQDCKRFSEHFAWHAAEPRAPRANKAKHAEKVEGHLDQARFWETAAAMLKEAKVEALGELLEDEELRLDGGVSFTPRH
jgi:hypothetical protein